MKRNICQNKIASVCMQMSRSHQQQQRRRNRFTCKIHINRISFAAFMFLTVFILSYQSPAFAAETHVTVHEKEVETEPMTLQLDSTINYEQNIDTIDETTNFVGAEFVATHTAAYKDNKLQSEKVIYEDVPTGEEEKYLTPLDNTGDVNNDILHIDNERPHNKVFSDFEKISNKTNLSTENLEESIRSSVKSEIEHLESSPALEFLKELPEPEIRETFSADILSLDEHNFEQSKTTPIYDKGNVHLEGEKSKNQKYIAKRKNYPFEVVLNKEEPNDTKSDVQELNEQLDSIEDEFQTHIPLSEESNESMTLVSKCKKAECLKISKRFKSLKPKSKPFYNNNLFQTPNPYNDTLKALNASISKSIYLGNFEVSLSKLEEAAFPQYKNDTFKTLLQQTNSSNNFKLNETEPKEAYETVKSNLELTQFNSNTLIASNSSKNYRKIENATIRQLPPKLHLLENKATNLEQQGIETDFVDKKEAAIENIHKIENQTIDHDRSYVTLPNNSQEHKSLINLYLSNITDLNANDNFAIPDKNDILSIALNETISADVINSKEEAILNLEEERKSYIGHITGENENYESTAVPKELEHVVIKKVLDKQDIFDNMSETLTPKDLQSKNNIIVDNKYLVRLKNGSNEWSTIVTEKPEYIFQPTVATFNSYRINWDSLDPSKASDFLETMQNKQISDNNKSNKTDELGLINNKENTTTKSIIDSKPSVSVREKNGEHTFSTNLAEKFSGEPFFTSTPLFGLSSKNKSGFILNNKLSPEKVNNSHITVFQYDDIVATLFEAYPPRDAKQTFNNNLADESADVGKALPVSTNEDSKKSTLIIILSSGTAFLFIIISVTIFLISFQRQHGTLDIEMQERSCGKDNLDEEDAQTFAKLIEVELPPPVALALDETEECL